VIPLVTVRWLIGKASVTTCGTYHKRFSPGTSAGRDPETELANQVHLENQGGGSIITITCTTLQARRHKICDISKRLRATHHGLVLVEVDR